MAKYCPGCDETKLAVDFYKNKARHDGLESYCKPCRRAQTNKYKADHKELIKIRNKKYRTNNAELIKKSTQQYKEKNKEHIKEKSKAYYLRTSKHQSITRKLRYLKNRDQILAKNKEWAKLNSEKYKELRNKWRRDQTKNNTPFALGVRLRTRFKDALKNNRKNSSAVRDLGMSLENFKTYLEMLWQPGMTWENYGSAWHIDHIFPLSRADLTCPYQLKAVLHFTNLQPLWASENITKGARLVQY